MKLWLDDLRPPPNNDWVWVKTVDEAISWMMTSTVEDASLDNDLGEDQPEGRKLILWMAVYDTWPERSIKIHSGNPVAADYMASMIERYAPFVRITGTRRFESLA